jgi:hypothetical protein
MRRYLKTRRRTSVDAAANAEAGARTTNGLSISLGTPTLAVPIPVRHPSSFAPI